jgi:hypothetical protein
MKDVMGWRPFGGGHIPTVTAFEESIEAGIYSLWGSPEGMVWEKAKLKSDTVFDLRGLPNKFIREQIETFWGSAEVYHRHGFVHKRGIMLYGEPGNGKTSVVSVLANDIIAANGIVLNLSNFSSAVTTLQRFRKVEPRRRLMLLAEDIDTLIGGDFKHEEPFALSLLDGQHQIDGVLFVATTNYPELIADRFIKRPGRFDLVVGLGPPMRETREDYIRTILPKVPEFIHAEIVEKTEGLSLAYLKEIAASYLCLGIPIEESVERLRSSFASKPRTKQAKITGFQIGYHDDEHQMGKTA